MSEVTTKSVRPASSAFQVKTGTSTATARAATQFDIARRNRIAMASPKGGFIVSPKDSAPGFGLIACAVAEAIFVEPVRSIRRKLRGAA
jgi:hypothetical protein